MNIMNDIRMEIPILITFIMFILALSHPAHAKAT